MAVLWPQTNTVFELIRSPILTFGTRRDDDLDFSTRIQPIHVDAFESHGKVNSSRSGDDTLGGDDQTRHLKLNNARSTTSPPTGTRLIRFDAHKP